MKNNTVIDLDNPTEISAKKIEELIGTNAGLILFIEAFIGKPCSHGFSDYISKKIEY